MAQEAVDLFELLRANPYPGRGIAMGFSPDGDQAVWAYFIMGRSGNSRNRVFVLEGQELRIIPHDRDAIRDAGLIFYHPTATHKNRLILTNGDQTDTILAALKLRQGFVSALRTRAFEPDAPHYTPRISGMMDLHKGGTIRLSVLRAADSQGTGCDRLFFEYPGLPGEGRFVHTYQGDGTPLPAFEGEPRRIRIPQDARAFAQAIWDSLNPENRVALCVRATALADGHTQFFIHQRHSIPEVPSNA